MGISFSAEGSVHIPQNVMAELNKLPSYVQAVARLSPTYAMLSKKIGIIAKSAELEDDPIKKHLRFLFANMLQQKALFIAMKQRATELYNEYLSAQNVAESYATANNLKLDQVPQEYEDADLALIERRRKQQVSESESQIDQELATPDQDDQDDQDDDQQDIRNHNLDIARRQIEKENLERDIARKQVEFENIDQEITKRQYPQEEDTRGPGNGDWFQNDEFMSNKLEFPVNDLSRPLAKILDEQAKNVEIAHHVYILAKKEPGILKMGPRDIAKLATRAYPDVDKEYVRRGLKNLLLV